MRLATFIVKVLLAEIVFVFFAVALTVTVTVFTFISVLLLYGGIMNFAAMLMNASFDTGVVAVSADALKTLYITGLPYDAAHAGGAALCVFLFGDAILQRLQADADGFALPDFRMGVRQGGEIVQVQGG